MDDRVIVITGASDGIGKEAARSLSAHARVVIVGRSEQKTRAVAKELGAPYYTADYARLDEVYRLGVALRRDFPRIHVLANNAGGVFGAREMTVDGHEKTMQVNYLAHFLLTNLLMDSLIAGRATVIATSSVAHRAFSRFDIDDLEMERHYLPTLAYGNSKLMNILSTKELDRRFREVGISAAAYHPGVVASNFSAGSTSRVKILYRQPFRRLLGLATSAEGADTLVWLATSRPGVDWQPGGYFAKRRPLTPTAQARDPALAARLWDESARMVADFLKK
jgi:NAD(P)-dependent dehydrogenase (short-subunit alcohol dehydrogenase family)